MGKITGTIIKLQNFLEDKDTDVKIDMEGAEQKSIISFKTNRRYIIPSFQRELRWGPKQVIEMIRDIQSSDKFLGNIILNKKNNDYDVIDGQQRITVIYMILDFLKEKYGSDQDIFDKCDLELQNFEEYKTFAEHRYGENLSEEVRTEVLKDDYYGQNIKFSSLYKLIPQYLTTKQNALNFYKNLCNCTFNVIVSSDDGISNQGIEYFLDVNLKGLKLDDEDIFKGYLFSLDNSDKMISKWNDIKKLIFEINNENKEIKYDLCSFLQHFMYSYIYDFDKYKNLEFGNDFLITKDVPIDGDKHYSGEHVVKVIWSKTFFLQMLTEAKAVLEIIKDITKNPIGVSGKLKKYLELYKVDSTEYPVINNYLAKILLDDKLIFKSLVIKYLRCLIKVDNSVNEVEKKSLCHDVYAIVLYISLYLIFSYKKDIKKIIPILKEKNIHNKLIANIKDLLDGKAVTDFTVDDNEKSQQYMAKLVASIYNFYCLEDNAVKIRDSKYTELKKFLDDIQDYSVEHFLINNSESYKIEEDGHEVEFAYPTTIGKKYKNSIFNYIFLPEALNKDLSNYDIHTKISIIEKNSQINCEYSKMYIEIAKKTFKDLRKELKDDNTQKRYFSYDFIQDEFVRFKIDLVKNVLNKVDLRKK